jgi:hypothetical protein
MRSAASPMSGRYALPLANRAVPESREPGSAFIAYGFHFGIERLDQRFGIERLDQRGQRRCARSRLMSSTSVRARDPRFCAFPARAASRQEYHSRPRRGPHGALPTSG